VVAVPLSFMDEGMSFMGLAGTFWVSASQSRYLLPPTLKYGPEVDVLPIWDQKTLPTCTDMACRPSAFPTQLKIHMHEQLLYNPALYFMVT
jgi:hypothetical protein